MGDKAAGCRHGLPMLMPCSACGASPRGETGPKRRCGCLPYLIRHQQMRRLGDLADFDPHGHNGGGDTPTQSPQSVMEVMMLPRTFSIIHSSIWKRYGK